MCGRDMPLLLLMIATPFFFFSGIFSRPSFPGYDDMGNASVDGARRWVGFLLIDK